MASTEIRNFDSGATRNSDINKPDYEGFISPVVLAAYGEYMHANRTQKDGAIRASDNWQQGIPFDNYLKSLVRHVFELWEFHRTGKAIWNVDTQRYFTRRELLTAILFNTMGYLKELILPSQLNSTKQTIYETLDREVEKRNSESSLKDKAVERIIHESTNTKGLGDSTGVRLAGAPGYHRANQRSLDKRRSEVTETLSSVGEREETQRDVALSKVQSACPICRAS